MSTAVRWEVWLCGGYYPNTWTLWTHTEAQWRWYCVNGDASQCRKHLLGVQPQSESFRCLVVTCGTRVTDWVINSAKWCYTTGFLLGRAQEALSSRKTSIPFWTPHSTYESRQFFAPALKVRFHWFYASAEYCCTLFITFRFWAMNRSLWRLYVIRNHSKTSTPIRTQTWSMCLEQ